MRHIVVDSDSSYEYTSELCVGGNNTGYFILIKVGAYTIKIPCGLKRKHAVQQYDDISISIKRDNT